MNSAVTTRIVLSRVDWNYSQYIGLTKSVLFAKMPGLTSVSFTALPNTWKAIASKTPCSELPAYGLSLLYWTNLAATATMGRMRRPPLRILRMPGGDNPEFQPVQILHPSIEKHLMAKPQVQQCDLFQLMAKRHHHL